MNSVIRLLVITALLLFVVAPFAGLAPLLVILLLAGVAWMATDWLSPLWGAVPPEKTDDSDTAHSS